MRLILESQELPRTSSTQSVQDRLEREIQVGLRVFKSSKNGMEGLLQYDCDYQLCRTLRATYLSKY